MRVKERERERFPKWPCNILINYSLFMNVGALGCSGRCVQKCIATWNGKVRQGLWCGDKQRTEKVVKQLSFHLISFPSPFSLHLRSFRFSTFLHLPLFPVHIHFLHPSGFLPSFAIYGFIILSFPSYFFLFILLTLHLSFAPFSFSFSIPLIFLFSSLIAIPFIFYIESLFFLFSISSLFESFTL